MKKSLLSFTLILLMLLSACGQEKTTVQPPKETEEITVVPLTWQEQYDLGIRFLSDGNYEEAILAFLAAIEIEPKRAELYESLAEAYLGIGDTDKAQETLEKGYTATGETYLYERLDLMQNALYYNEPNPIMGTEDINISELITHEQVTVDGVPFWGMTYETLLNAIWEDGTQEWYVREEDPAYQNALSNGSYSTENHAKMVSNHVCLNMEYGMSATYRRNGVEIPKSLHYGLVTGVNGIVLGEDKESVLSKLGFSYAASEYLANFGEIVVFCDLYGAGILTNDSLNAWDTIAMEFVPGTGGSVERLRVDFRFEEGALYNISYSTY